MTNDQLKAAVAIAQDQTVRFINDKGEHLEDITIFDGYGLPSFKQVVCTIRQIAFLIRWQVAMLSGGYDADALNELASVGRRKFNVVG